MWLKFGRKVRKIRFILMGMLWMTFVCCSCLLWPHNQKDKDRLCILHTSHGTSSGLHNSLPPSKKTFFLGHGHALFSLPSYFSMPRIEPSKDSLGIHPVSAASGMGTQFEYAVNLVAASRGGDAFPYCGLDERGYPRNGNQEGMGSTSSERIPGSMGEPADENSLESVRRKMQMQEDIFRKQVRELHRLYGIQKKLMGELKKEMEQSRLLSIMRSRHAGFLNRPHQTAAGHTLHLQHLSDEQGSQERSASSSGEASRFPRGLDLEIRQLKRLEKAVLDGELSCPSFVPPVRRDAPQVDDGLDEETDVELTLTIGGRSSKSKSSNCSQRQREHDVESSKKKQSSASIASDQGDASNSNTSNMGGSSTTSDQEKKRPHWLFRG